MKKIRTFIVMLLCVSLLAFAGCGNDNDTAGDVNNDGTVREETTDMNNNEKNNNGDNIVDDVEDGAKDMADDVKDAVDDIDGKGNSRETESDRNDGTNN